MAINSFLNYVILNIHLVELSIVITGIFISYKINFVKSTYLEVFNTCVYLMILYWIIQVNTNEINASRHYLPINLLLIFKIMRSQTLLNLFINQYSSYRIDNAIIEKSLIT